MLSGQKSILFLPGLNCTGALFQPQIEAFSPTHACMIADHGSSSRLEETVEAVLHNAPAEFAMVGLSMGGYLAFEVMRQQPKRVNAIALLDTRASSDTLEDAERRHRTIELAQNGKFEALHEILWPRLVHPDRINDIFLENTVKAMMRETGAERFIRQQTAVLNRHDPMSVLSRISVPVLIGVGRGDMITPLSMAHELSSSIRGASLEIFENCGHLSTLEQPETVTTSLVKFLASL
jgi:pimeloyl-ACP methyl ester carboxylesterase